MDIVEECKREIEIEHRNEQKRVVKIILRDISFREKTLRESRKELDKISAMTPAEFADFAPAGKPSRH